MKRHIMIGLFTMFVLIPAVGAFSAPDTPMPLSPEQQGDLNIQAPSFIWEFPYAPNGVGGLTFVLHITHFFAQNSQFIISTTPAGQNPIQRAFGIGPNAILNFSAADALCASGTVCQIAIINPTAAFPEFGPTLEIFTTSGVPVQFLSPSQTFFTQ